MCINNGVLRGDPRIPDCPTVSRLTLSYMAASVYIPGKLAKKYTIRNAGTVGIKTRSFLEHVSVA